MKPNELKFTLYMNDHLKSLLEKVAIAEKKFQSAQSMMTKHLEAHTNDPLYALQGIKAFAVQDRKQAYADLGAYVAGIYQELSFSQEDML